MYYSPRFRSARLIIDGVIQRVIDDVPMAIDNKFLEGFRDRLQDFLLDKLGIGGFNSTERCASYLAEDPVVVAERVNQQEETTRECTNRAGEFRHVYLVFSFCSWKNVFVKVIHSYSEPTNSIENNSSTENSSYSRYSVHDYDNTQRSCTFILGR